VGARFILLRVQKIEVKNLRHCQRSRYVPVQYR
jgi:hypothetical protein